MPAQLNHLIIAARDKQESVRFLTGLLKLDEPVAAGIFLVVRLDNGVTLDYIETQLDIPPQHYAFLVSDDVFDFALSRIRERGIEHWADPRRAKPREINTNDGGRGVYFVDPAGHYLEIITRPYGGGPGLASAESVERDVREGSDMQAELNRLEKQLAHALAGEAWHGPSVLETIEGVSAEQAASHPIAGAHSIWELVLHLCGTYDLVLRRLTGDGRQMTEAEDWPTVTEPTDENWRMAVERLKQMNEQLRQAVKTFDAARLDEPLVAEPPYTAYTQFIGLTQHDLYHAGQIVLLKKALGQ